LSLSGIESDNVFINLLKPESFSPLIALVGIILTMVSKSDKRKSVGYIMLGFAVLMYGMELMKVSMEPLADMPEFKDILLMFNNPLLGVLVGAVFTGVIQSSAASVGILQALSLAGGVTYGMALPIIMGQNIGTCVTALLSSIGVNRNAKKVAVVHISFNLIGTVLFLIVFYGLDALFHFPITDMEIDPFGIAVVHTIFNVTTTVILLPFAKLLEKIANRVVKDKGDELHYTFIDKRLLATPAVAISECTNRTVKMASLSKESVLSALGLLDTYDAKKAEAVRGLENEIDTYEDKLGTYLVLVSGKELSESDSTQVSKLLHAIGDFERLSDHAVNLVEVAAEINDKKLEFSAEATEEMAVLRRAVSDILELTINAFEQNDITLAAQVEPLEQVIDGLSAEIRARHIQRLQSGNCTIELGFVLSDLLNNYERISDHCSNIAVNMIEMEHQSFRTHKYLNNLKTVDQSFVEMYNSCKTQYRLKEQYRLTDN
jgi:phosphate:Na+ symporter